MFSRNKLIGLSIAALAAGVFFVGDSTPASADDAHLAVTPAVYRSTESNPGGASVQLVRYGYGRGGWGYRGYGWGGYGYRPYYRPYVYGAYPAVGFGYPAYGYGYPAYGYGYPGYYAYGPRVGVGVGIW